MNCSSNPIQIIASMLIILACSTVRVNAAGVELPEKSGMAAAYPGDVGIEKNPAVVFAENFEEGTLDALLRRWTHSSDKDGRILAFSTDVASGSGGRRSLQMTATRGENSGGNLFKVLSSGHDELYVRLYTRFAADYGFCHHFVRIRGMIDPVPYPLGQISKQPSHRWCGTDIEPLRVSQFGGLAMPTSPPGVWALSSYWPEMRSWQGPGGTSFYPDLFEPQKRVAVARGRWICVEVMVKMNSSPDKSDGAQAAWIDGELVSCLGPRTVSGYWRRDKYILDDEKGEPFEGFRWRKDMPLKWNRLWLLHYVSERSFKKSDAYAAEHPDAPINTQTAAVWFDDIVVATEYIGPSGEIEPRQRPNKGHVKALNAKPKRPNEPNVFFYWDCENEADGSILPNPPFWFGWKFVGSSTGPDIVDHPERCAHVVRGRTPEGRKYFQWKITDEDNHSCYTEVKERGFPIRCTLGKTYYLAYYFNFTRINERDIWHERGQSADKGVELKGSGVRWCFSRGHWGGGYARNEDHRYTVWLGNPTYHLNRELEHTDAYYPNQNGYSAKNPIQLDYERWYSCVMAVKMAADKTGSVAVWIDGMKLCEYENIKTCANTNPSITQITMGGTIAQPAYDAPAHYRKFDALLLTDNWQNIIDLGYLKKDSGSGRD